MILVFVLSVIDQASKYAARDMSCCQHHLCSQPIMKTIIDDPEGLFESGGWSFLDPNSGSEDEKDEDDDIIGKHSVAMKSTRLQASSYSEKSGHIKALSS